MQAEDLILVSVDDHVVEPPDLFEGRLSSKAQERAPFVTKLEGGRDVWMFEGNALPNVGLNAVAGRVPEEYGLDALSFDQMRPGCYDIHERIRDMNVNGVLGSLNFPSLTGFCGQLFSTCEDKDIALELVQVYNDWHIDTWCGTYPGRMIPLAIPPIWDVDLMAAEVRRTAEKGCHAVTFSENPEKLGLPSFHSDYWDPFWQACCDTDTVVCMHIGSSSTLVSTSSDAPIDTLITLQPMNIVLCAADLLWSPVLRKFDKLRVALSEGGIGWVPYFLERVDYTYQHHNTWTNQDFGDKLPEPGLQREDPDVLHRRRGRDGDPSPPQPGSHPLGVRLPALRLHLAERAGDGVEVPPGPSRRGHQQDHAPERDEELLVRCLLAHPQGAGHGRCAPRPGLRCRHRPRELWHRQVPGRGHRDHDDPRRADVEEVVVSSGGRRSCADHRVQPASTGSPAPMTDLPFRVPIALDETNEFFWSSGQDGQLRFQRCQGCGYFLHPPGPRCPKCGGTDLEAEPVSGQGVVHTFTINHQAWVGETEPYVIAIVQLAEQDDLRLTTNIVGCPVEDVQIGDEVTVTFEHHDPVWVPVFERNAS